MTTLTYHIPNISCGHCVHTIELEIGDLEGVIQVKAEEATQIVTVDFEAPATESQIATVLQEINYPPA